jgi:hypothetical protein
MITMVIQTLNIGRDQNIRIFCSARGVADGDLSIIYLTKTSELPHATIVSVANTITEIPLNIFRNRLLRITACCGCVAALMQKW